MAQWVLICISAAPVQIQLPANVPEDGPSSWATTWDTHKFLAPGFNLGQPWMLRLLEDMENFCFFLTLLFK